jgi:hypothetical protein
VRTLRGVVGCDIEVHLHNDTGMGQFYTVPSPPHTTFSPDHLTR